METRKKGFLALTVRTDENVIIETAEGTVEVILGKAIGNKQRQLLFKAPKTMNIKRGKFIPREVAE